LRHRERNKRIIGIDPGSIYCGYGVIERVGKDGAVYVASGRLAMSRDAPLHERLRELFMDLRGLIREFHPSEAAVERVFFAKGARAALSLGHARGVALLAATIEDVTIYEYSALEVKKSVVGYGRADKKQVKGMVSSILGIGHPLSEDSADALALALCHINTENLNILTGKA